MDENQIPVICVMGPTASGKSDFAMRLARRVPAEIVSVDSAQVYRGMDIGTAKPSAAERAATPHHLLDILDPAQAYSAARFCADATRLIGEIRARGKIPLLVGGTMLYFRTLQSGLSDLPSANPQVRTRLETEAREIGWPAMHARLAARDPQSAARLSPNDGQRIQRALEIIEVSGVTPSRAYEAGLAARGFDGAMVKFALCPPERAHLHQRIEQRLDRMMRDGFVEEVARLHARADLHADLPSMRCVGYRQIWQHLDGAYSRDEAARRALFATRQFAKRQLTWLRSESDLHWLDPADALFEARAMELLDAAKSRAKIAVLD